MVAFQDILRLVGEAGDYEQALSFVNANAIFLFAGAASLLAAALTRSWSLALLLPSIVLYAGFTPKDLSRSWLEPLAPGVLAIISTVLLTYGLLKRHNRADSDRVLGVLDDMERRLDVFLEALDRRSMTNARDAERNADALGAPSAPARSRESAS